MRAKNARLFPRCLRRQSRRWTDWLGGRQQRTGCTPTTQCRREARTDRGRPSTGRGVWGIRASDDPQRDARQGQGRAGTEREARDDVGGPVHTKLEPTGADYDRDDESERNRRKPGQRSPEYEERQDDGEGNAEGHGAGRVTGRE